MNATQQKIKEAQEKSIEWIELLATKSDQDLERRLHINHMQFAIAEKEKKEDVGQLLNIMERIIIQARIYKAENNIPDVPSEIELAIADIETVIVKSEERQEILNEFNTPVKNTHPKKQVQDNSNDEQLSLF